MVEMRLSGSGGQGLILAGIILAEAAILDGKLAIQSQSYGPEARGGASKAEVIIADTTIHYPKVTSPNLVLAMTQEAANKYSADIPADGILIVDTTFVREIPEQVNNVRKLPITEACKTELGKTLFANIVALGAINRIVGAVSEESLIRAIFGRVPHGTEEINEKAVRLGFSLVDSTSNSKECHKCLH